MGPVPARPKQSLAQFELKISKRGSKSKVVSPATTSKKKAKTCLSQQTKSQPTEQSKKTKSSSKDSKKDKDKHAEQKEKEKVSEPKKKK